MIQQNYCKCKFKNFNFEEKKTELKGPKLPSCLPTGLVTIRTAGLVIVIY